MAGRKLAPFDGVQIDHLGKFDDLCLPRENYEELERARMFLGDMETPTNQTARPANRPAVPNLRVLNSAYRSRSTESTTDP